MRRVEQLLADLKLHTVCEGAHCPNIGQCFRAGTATFIIMGDVCTRNCTFCAVSKGIPLPLDDDEPQRIAEAGRQLGLNYVVITCVTRDDLPDGGAAHFAKTVRILHTTIPKLRVEVLVSDFNGNKESIKTAVEASPEVFAHNLETVPRLYPFIRHMACYQRSLDVLRTAKELNPNMVTKSGLMLGLGEKQNEVIDAMHDLRQAGCELLALGQYLAPSQAHHPVVDFITPEKFAEYEKIGLDEGFKGIASAPLVRSSFRAAELFDSAINNRVIS
ncbi:MAG: lipoyl synthase [Dehalococcoidia bacterium]|nr:lipoyl synthase [Dehalococcoidia bacterium]